MGENNSTINWERMFIWIKILAYKIFNIQIKNLYSKKIIFFIILFLFNILLIPNIFAVNFQIEWNSQTISPETWTQINLTNTYDNPIVVASPEYSITTNAYGISVWVTNVTSNSFIIRTSDENFGAADSINVHYIVMEKGAWKLPNSNIKIESGKLSTNKVGISGSGNHQCPTHGETISFSNSFNNNPLVISTRGSNNNPSSWALTFQNDPSNQLNTVPVDKMCIGLSQSKAISPGAITNNETIYWIAVDEGNGTLSGVEYEILWNLQDTGDSGANWINGYGDPKPFTQSWTHTWAGNPNVIVGSITSTAGSDGGWGVIYDTGNSASIRMFVDEANERSHTGSESGGGWAFNTNGNYGNIPPSNDFINFSKSLIFLNKNNTINATVTDINGNNTIDSVIVTVKSPNSTKYNVSLNPEKINENLTTGDIENGTKNYTAISEGEIIGETGKLQLANRTSQLITFTQNYSQTPVLIAIATSANNDNSPFIPIIHSINRTHANISLCRDNGATTCDNNYLLEDIHYAVFDINKSNNYSWLKVGKINITTDGIATGFSFGKTFTNTPYLWALPQTYNIGSTVTNGIAAHSWFDSITTTDTNIIGCDHPGTSDTCAGTATEEFGYVAIDIANANFSKFDAGTQTISNSDWTGISYSENYIKPRIFVMVNSETGGQDGKYPWAKSVTTTGADVRYCEADGANYCDSHNGEVTNWFVLENGPIGIGNGGNDLEKNITIKTYNNIFTETTHNITSITLQINITKYNNSGSNNKGNKNPDLEIEFATGASNWKGIGLLNITATGIYTINITDSQIMDSWEIASNRNLRISGVNFDYFSSFQKDIIAYNLSIINIYYETFTSKWSNIFSNTEICGQYNLTDLYSTDKQNAINHSIYNGINFSIPCNPIIKLTSPINKTKLMTNGNVNLTWNILSPDSTLSCDVYINSVFNQTVSCNSSINNSLNIKFGGGYFNWTINVTDTNNLSSIATEESFLNILNKYMSITKSISSINSDLYLININIENKLNISKYITPIDFVNSKFNYGSFNNIYDWLNLTNSIYNGTSLGWDLITNSLSINEINYSITKNTNEYNLLDEFIIGLN